MRELPIIQQVSKAFPSPHRQELLEIREKGEHWRHVFSHLRPSKQQPDAVEADYTFCDEHGPVMEQQTVLIEEPVTQGKEFSWRNKDARVAAGLGAIVTTVVVGGIFVHYKQKNKNS